MHFPSPRAAGSSSVSRLLLGFGLLVVGFGTVGVASETGSPAAFPEQLRKIIAQHRLAGAVALVASRDRVLSEQAVGWKDVASQQPMAPNTIFWIASMSKSLTATALMMLVDEGKVKLDDPVSKYLPIFKNQMVVKTRDQNQVVLEKPIHPVTIRNLLDHTAGLVKFLPMAPAFDAYSLEEDVREYALIPLQFQPGTTFDYTNAGPNTVGRIIEVVTGMRYADFMQQRIFDPLGMTDTTFWPTVEQLSRLATTYKENAESNLQPTRILPLTYPLSDRNRNPLPAGGLFSTAKDVATFCRLILNDGVWEGKRFLSAAAVKEMSTTQTIQLQIGAAQNGGYAGMRGYGLGWRTDPDLKSGVFGHGGAYDTDMNIDPRHGLVMVLLVQKFNMLQYAAMRNDFIAAVEADFAH